MWQVRELWHHRHHHILTVISTTVALVLVLSVELCSSALRDGVNTVMADMGMNVTFLQIVNDRNIPENWLEDFENEFPVKDISLMYIQEDDEFTTVFCDEKLYRLLPIDIHRGRFISESEMNFNDSVAVLGHRVWEEYDHPDIGDEIHVHGLCFTVLGILSQGEGSMYLDPDETIFLPAGYRFSSHGYTAQCLFHHEEGYPEYYLDRILGRDNYFITDQKQISMAMDGIVSLVGKTARMLSTVCMAVALMGLLNSTLSSISQRSYEIGIKKAMGASDADIIRQFVLETVMVIGVALSMAVLMVGLIVLALKAITSEELTVHYEECAAVIVRILTAGIILGIYPAYKASRITIMQAIRTDNRD